MDCPESMRRWWDKPMAVCGRVAPPARPFQPEMPSENRCRASGGGFCRDGGRLRACFVQTVSSSTGSLGDIGRALCTSLTPACFTSVAAAASGVSATSRSCCAVLCIRLRLPSAQGCAWASSVPDPACKVPPYYCDCLLEMPRLKQACQVGKLSHRWHLGACPVSIV
jgi:hypothetical protein